MSGKGGGQNREHLLLGAGLQATLSFTKTAEESEG